MITSPLEQFEIVLLRPIIYRGVDLSFTNASAYAMLVLGLIWLISYLGVSISYLVPGRYQVILEQLYLFVYNMLIQQAGRKAEFAFPLILTTFVIILVSNLLGLTPFGFTLTGQIVITGALALSFNLGFLFLGLALHRKRFFSLFVPQGVPAILVPLIVVIEIVSYLIRTFSLSLRLFANMMAGHTLLNILSSFVVALLSLTGWFKLVALVPFLLVFFVTILEVGIAFLQAYVFTILLCIYLNDALNLH